MNLTITPINFQKFQKRNLESITVAKSVSQTKNSTFFQNYSSIYSSQIYFSASFIPARETLLAQSIDEHYLEIGVEDLGYVLKPRNFKDEKFLSYYKKGENILNTYLKANLYEKYPHKSQEEIEEIALNSLNNVVFSKILYGLFPKNLLKKGEGYFQADDCKKALCALIGLMFKKENYEALGGFISQDIIPLLERNLSFKNTFNSFEALADLICKKENKNQTIEQCTDNIHIYIDDNKCEIYYKDTLLAQELDNETEAQELKEKCILKAIKALENDSVDISLAWNILPFETYQKPSKYRKNQLQEFQREYNLEFNDINLLHKVFLCGYMPNDSILSEEKSNEKLINIGEEVLEACAGEYILYNLDDLAKTMQLANKWALGGDCDDTEIFKALIGAIFLDDKDYGLDNVQYFLKENFGKPTSTKKENSSPIEKLNDRVEFRYNNDTNKYATLANTINKYNLKLKPAELAYVFNIDSFKDEAFKRKEAIGSSFFRMYLKTFLYEKFPFKNEGELTQIAAKLIKHIEPIILTTLFDGNLFHFYKEPDSGIYSSFFYALIGEIAQKNETSCIEFLKNHTEEIIDLNLISTQSNEYEIFQEKFKQAGYEPNDLKLHTKRVGGLYVTKCYYKDKLLPNIIKTLTPQQGETEAHNKILSLISQKDIFDETFEKGTLSSSAKKTQNERTKILKEFCIKHKLNFQNIDLLNRAFTCQFFEDGSIVSHQDSYQALEFIGDSVLGYCVRKILYDYFSKAEIEYIESKYVAFTKNENLSKIAKNMNLENYLTNKNENNNRKVPADIFESLIGAIYLDSGLESVFDFLNYNFKLEILTK